MAETNAVDYFAGLAGLGTAIGSNYLNQQAGANALNAITGGVSSANAGVGAAVANSAGILNPFITAGQNALAGYNSTAQNFGFSDTQKNDIYDNMNSYYNPYTSAGANAANQLGGAISNLQGIGSSEDYYNRTLPAYLQNIQAGQNSLTPAQQLAQATAGGYGYSDFENSGYYKALEAANLQAQRQLAAQGSAAGMFGSGTMANALGQRMQENYANYYGQGLNADLQTKQAAAQQYANLISQGLTAQQAASAVASNMMSNDTSKSQSVINALAGVAGAGATATGNSLTASQNYINSGLNEQTAKLNALYNMANLGQTAGQALGGDYLKGAEIIGKNTLGSANATAVDAFNSASSTSAMLSSLLNNKDVINMAKSLGKSAYDYALELLNSQDVQTGISFGGYDVGDWDTSDLYDLEQDYYTYNPEGTWYDL